MGLIFGILVVGFLAFMAGIVVRAQYETAWKAALVCAIGSVVFGVLVAATCGTEQVDDGDAAVETPEFSAMNPREREREQVSAFWKGAAVAGIASLSGAFVGLSPLVDRMKKNGA